MHMQWCVHIDHVSCVHVRWVQRSAFVTPLTLPSIQITDANSESIKMHIALKMNATENNASASSLGNLPKAVLTASTTT